MLFVWRNSRGSQILRLPILHRILSKLCMKAQRKLRLTNFLQPFSLPCLFIFPLPSALISLFNFSFIFLYFASSYLHPSYYKFVILSFILCINLLPHKKILSLSLSLSLNFLVDFLFFLHLYFRLINFCVYKFLCFLEV